MMWHYGMPGFGLFGLIVMVALLVVPFWRLMPRFGLPNWVALVAIIPLGALVLLWVIALKDKIDAAGGAK